jgi:tetratricopeptide (TPR) repeat protein
VWLAGLLRKYTYRRDRASLAQAEEIIPKLRRYDPENYLARLCAAMSAFVLRRDLPAAKKELEACRRVEDGTWRYSEAFLHGYEGELDEAYRSYQKAFAAPLEDPTVPTQSEEFIQIVLDEEPERPWLYYCLGLINHRPKGDLHAALRDFRSFIDGVDPTRFKKQIGTAEKWIGDIMAVMAPPGVRLT